MLYSEKKSDGSSAGLLYSYSTKHLIIQKRSVPTNTKYRRWPNIKQASRRYFVLGVAPREATKVFNLAIITAHFSAHVPSLSSVKATDRMPL